MGNSYRRMHQLWPSRCIGSRAKAFRGAGKVKKTRRFKGWRLLSSDKVLVHFDPTLPVGISCDASNVGIGAVLLHCFPDGSERPIANASKTLTQSQRNYSQIQKEAMAIVYALKKFYHYLFGRRFIIVTDHKPLLTLFGPENAMPSLAANRLARCALFLNQFSYQIVYRKTSEHQNDDVLSGLPAGDDPVFDAEEDADDVDTVCMVKSLHVQVRPSDPASLETETAKDPVLTKVMLLHERDGPPRIKPMLMIPQKSFGRLPFPCPLTMGASSTDYELWSLRSSVLLTPRALWCSKDETAGSHRCLLAQHWLGHCWSLS